MLERLYKLGFCVSILLTCFISCADDDKKNSDHPCGLIPDSGPCEAAIVRYYFDQEEQKCTEFIWGGCDGVVPFETLEECLQCERN